MESYGIRWFLMFNFMACGQNLMKCLLKWNIPICQRCYIIDIQVDVLLVSGTAEGEGLVGPRSHHFFAPQPPLFENQILWFYSFFRFSIWKNYFQLSALPLFTLLRGPCVLLHFTNKFGFSLLNFDIYNCRKLKDSSPISYKIIIHIR